ncbi:hypothetical protein C8R45DRAFT_1101319 [Mycena sanguinolenta]|nr:hypothetical protein C8R45DRAFT_1101319 [Mycena sanguinolenta]
MAIDLVEGSTRNREQAVSHIKRALPVPDSPVSEQSMIHLIGIAGIISYAGDPYLGFGYALLSTGIVVPLAIVGRALCHSTLDKVRIPLRVLFSALVELISSSIPAWLPESFRAGLLRLCFLLGIERQYLLLWPSFLKMFSPQSACTSRYLDNSKHPSRKYAIGT